MLRLVHHIIIDDLFYSGWDFDYYQYDLKRRIKYLLSNSLSVLGGVVERRRQIDKTY